MRTSRTESSGRTSARTVALLALAVLAGSCQSFDQQPPAGDLYHHNWWNYYERGVAFLNSAKVAEAQSDFEICLGLKSGAKFGFPEERWRVRTYGLHVLDGYFPHRELGICHYRQGNVAKAVEFLEQSMRLTPSGRAKHYLNLARGLAIKGQRLPPPDIRLAEDTRPVWTRERSRLASGRAYAQGRVAELHVNGQPQFIELAETNASFAQTIPLAQGTNTVVVRAVDLAGQTSERQAVWVADWQPPELCIRTIQRDGDNWVVEGICSDDQGLRSVTVDSQPLGSGAPSARRLPVRVTLPAGRPAVFVAEDLAGNRLRTALTPAIGNIQLVAADNALACQLAAAAAPAAAAGLPVLALGNVSPVSRVLTDEFFLDGSAGAAAGLASIRIGTNEVLEADSHGAVRAYFSRRIAVVRGTNLIDVAVRDAAGAEATRRLTVIRRDPEYMSAEYRLALVIPPPTGDLARELAERVRIRLQDEWLREPPRFHVLEHAEGWEYILREQKLSVSDLADPRAALRIGKLLPSDLLLLSSLIPHAQGLTVHARVVEADDGRIVFDTDVYSDAVDKDLPRQIAGLALKIQQRFPLVTGDVVRQAGREITINRGGRDGLTPETRFIVVRPASGAEGTRVGTVCRTEERFVELRMRSVSAETGTAQVFPAAAGKLVKEGDYVYAR